MNPIYLLKELGLLENKKTMLDVGTRDGAIASKFADLGLTVNAIDIHKPKHKIVNVNFEQISIKEFLIKNELEFDVVVARHVLHHLQNPKVVLEGLNAIAGVFFFTCFGPKDEWFGQVSTLAHDEVLDMFSEARVVHHSEAFQYGKTYAGNIKFWHISTFVINNR